MEQLESNLKSVKKNLKQLTSDRNEALDDCRKLVKEKEEMETDLYQKVSGHFRVQWSFAKV